MKKLLIGLLALGSFSAFATSVSRFVINGEEIDSKSKLTKSTVALSENGRFKCSGVLISNDVVLTAAHCVNRSSLINLEYSDPKPLSIVFSHDLGLRGELSLISSSVPKRKVLSALRNLTFTEGGFGGSENQIDLAVIRFEGKLPKGYAPAKIIPTRMNIKAHSKLTIVGFGYETHNGTVGTGAGILRQGHAVLSNDLADYKASRILTLSRTDNQGLCYGDSGGPTFIEVDEEFFLVGVNSSSINEDCSGDSNVVNLNGNDASDWIKYALKRLPLKDVGPLGRSLKL